LLEGLARLNGIVKSRAGLAVRPDASKHRLRADSQPETPRQPRVIGKNDAVSPGNHGRYIDNRPGFDNEAKTSVSPGPASGGAVPAGRNHTQW